MAIEPKVEDALKCEAEPILNFCMGENTTVERGEFLVLNTQELARAAGIVYIKN